MHTPFYTKAYNSRIDPTQRCIESFSDMTCNIA
jgi:hypothetical protein